jgi:2-methylisocitrate lyase-like PEP mutase family enzyme
MLLWRTHVTCVRHPFSGADVLLAHGAQNYWFNSRHLQPSLITPNIVNTPKFEHIDAMTHDEFDDFNYNIVVSCSPGATGAGHQQRQQQHQQQLQ